MPKKGYVLTQEQKDRAKESMRKFLEAHPGYHAAYHKAHHVPKPARTKMTKEEAAARSKAKRAANKEKCAAQNRKYKAANREKIAAQARARYHARIDSSREKLRKSFAIRKSRLLQATNIADSALKHIYAVASSDSAVRCFYCNKVTRKSLRHVDHVVPLSKGGSHTSGNLVIACQRCNLSKGAKNPNELGVLC